MHDEGEQLDQYIQALKPQESAHHTSSQHADRAACVATLRVRRVAPPSAAGWFMNQLLRFDACEEVGMEGRETGGLH